jgi:hypothetical protein
LSCILELKPCDSKTHINTICYSDCVWLINECGHKEQMELNGLTSKGLCSLIAPFDTTGCLSLGDFILEDHLGVNPIAGGHHNNKDMTYPCQPNPCKDGFICEPNRKCDLSRVDCMPFHCMEGCNTDMRSSFLVEKEEWVKIGVPGRADCTQLCQCGTDNAIQSCEPMVCGSGQRNCSVNGQVYGHGKEFLSDCNHCICYDSQVTCSKTWNCSNSVCGDNACDSVQVHCEGVIPPGQCCLICGATISFLVVSKSQEPYKILSANETDKIIYYMNRLVTTLECIVEGFSHNKSSLVVAVKSTVDKPEAIPVCNAEARRLVSLFKSRSPIITSNPLLDYLLAPQLQEPTPIYTTSSPFPPSSHITHQIQIPLLFLFLSLYSILVS